MFFLVMVVVFLSDGNRDLVSQLRIHIQRTLDPRNPRPENTSHSVTGAQSKMDSRGMEVKTAGHWKLEAKRFNRETRK